MSKISNTGLNLDIIISSDRYDKVGDWMTFATWYSFAKFFPDSRFFIAVPKISQAKEIFYYWIFKAEVKRFFHPLDTQKLIENNFLRKNYLYVTSQSLVYRRPKENELKKIEEGIVSNFDIYSSGNNEEVNWLASDTLSDNPIILKTGPVVGQIDLDKWVKQIKDPPFTAKWTAQSIEESFVQSVWAKLNFVYSNYYSNMIKY